MCLCVWVYVRIYAIYASGNMFERFVDYLELTTKVGVIDECMSTTEKEFD